LTTVAAGTALPDDSTVIVGLVISVSDWLPVEAPPGRRAHVRDLDRAWLEARRIRTARHCFGCTAGAGSSCGGATT